MSNQGVQRGNSYKDQPHGRATVELWYREARQTIEECLAVPRLYHLRPIPREDFPPEMISLFEGVRADLFGDFRVVDLDPPDAIVILDGDTLRATCDSCSLELRESTQRSQDDPCSQVRLQHAHRGRDDLTEFDAGAIVLTHEGSGTLMVRTAAG